MKEIPVVLGSQSVSDAADASLAEGVHPVTTVKSPSEWTLEERRRVIQAIEEHRLSRVDLFYWQAIDVENQNPFDVAREMMLTIKDVNARALSARERLAATFARPSQAAYLDRWLSPEE